MDFFSFLWPFALLLIAFYFLNEKRHYIDSRASVLLSLIILGSIYMCLYFVYKKFYYQINYHGEVAAWILVVVYLLLKYVLKPKEDLELQATQICLHPSTRMIDKDKYRKRMQEKNGKDFAIKNIYRTGFKETRYFVKKFKNVMNFVKDIRIQPLKYAEIKAIKKRIVTLQQEGFTPVQNSVVNMIKQIYIDLNKREKSLKIEEKYKSFFTNTSKTRFEVDKHLIQDFKEAIQYFSYPIGNLYLLAENVFDRELLGCLQNLQGTKLQPMGFSYYEIFENERSI